MNRLSSFDISYSILLSYTLLASPVFALPQSIWQVHIENGPSASAEDSPPLSKGAIRDPAYLPVQIGGIVGSYLITLIFISVAILTVGRRLRRKAQKETKTLGMEVIQPNTNLVPMQHRQQHTVDTKELAKEGIWEVTPVSPTKDVPWSLKSWASMKKNSHSHAGSVATFNESVVSDHQARNEIEMDRLYAAVAEHEAKRSQPASPPMGPPMSPLNQNPPEFQHLRYGKQQYHQDNGLLPSPPPEDDMPRSPTSPQSTSKRGNKKPSPLNFHNPPSRDSSRSSFSSFASFGRKKSQSIRNLPISPPMGSPEINPDSRYLESEPLTPRHYKPGPPPPTPPGRYRSNQEPVASPLPIDEDGRKYFFSHEIRSSRASMSTQGYTPSQTPRTATFPVFPPDSLRQEQYQDLGGNNTISITLNPSSAAPTPRVVPNTPLPQIGIPQSPRIRLTQQDQQLNQYAQQPAPQTNYSVPRIMSITPPVRTGTTESGETLASRRKPTPLNLAGGASNNNSQTTLPLRTAPLPLRALRSPTSTRPVSTIKNTELTRPDPASSRTRGGLTVPGTAGAVPATPYSPFYMPMTPLTPMTPSRLVTREERKRQKKEEGRRALTQDDMVVDEGEMWGEGY